LIKLIDWIIPNISGCLQIMHSLTPYYDMVFITILYITGVTNTFFNNYLDTDVNDCYHVVNPKVISFNPNYFFHLIVFILIKNCILNFVIIHYEEGNRIIHFIPDIESKKKIAIMIFVIAHYAIGAMTRGFYDSIVFNYIMKKKN